MRPKKKKEQDTNRWMQTYSDMITLLLVFFVLLYSISVIDVEKFRRVMDSIQLSFTGQPGILEQTTDLEELEDIETVPEGETISVTEDEMKVLEKMREAAEVMDKVADFLSDAGLEDDVEFRVEDRGVVMELPDQIFFKIGQADLRPEAQTVLNMLGDLFRDLNNQIIIEGHTCDLPIQTVRFPSNWELSVGRSVAVTRYLVEERGLSPDRLIATGYGEYQPLYPNDSEENRSQNRRVTVVISIF